MKMKPGTWIIAIVLGVGAALGWHFAGRADTEVSGQERIRVAGVDATSTPALRPPPADDAAADADPVERLIADANGGDAVRRAAAITALAKAPREQAMPVLGRLLANGEPLVDRPLALASLRTLALEQGDADGKIRDAIRAVIYHGDDHTNMNDVQETLDVIETATTR
jgi:hypothetical protein